MTVRFQAQAQEQQQEAAPAATPAAAPQTSATATDSDDSIIGDILKGDAKEPSGDADGEDDAPGDQSEADGDDDHDAEDTGDSDEDDSLESDDAAEPDDADDPDEGEGGSLKAARKAAADGDVEKAFKLAFGKNADKMLSANKLFTAVRAAKRKADHAVQAERAQVVQREQQGQQWVAQQRQQISSIIDQLRPYEEIHQARVAFQQSGDPEHLKAIIEKTSGMTYDEAQKAILTKLRRSPGERALQQQVQTLMQKLEEKERKQAEESQQLTQQQQYQNDIGIISSSLKGEVTKVPRYAERVYAVLAKTKTPTGLAMTIEEAGRRVLHAERKKLAKHPLLTKPVAPKNPVSAAAATLAKARKGKGAAPVLRRDSRGNGATEEGSESTDDIIGDILKSKNRVRA